MNTKKIQKEIKDYPLMKEEENHCFSSTEFSNLEETQNYDEINSILKTHNLICHRNSKNIEKNILKPKRFFSMTPEIKSIVLSNMEHQLLKKNDQKKQKLFDLSFEELKNVKIEKKENFNFKQMTSLQKTSKKNSIILKEKHKSQDHAIITNPKIKEIEEEIMIWKNKLKNQENEHLIEINQLKNFSNEGKDELQFFAEENKKVKDMIEELNKEKYLVLNSNANSYKKLGDFQILKKETLAEIQHNEDVLLKSLIELEREYGELEKNAQNPEIDEIDNILEKNPNKRIEFLEKENRKLQHEIIDWSKQYAQMEKNKIDERKLNFEMKYIESDLTKQISKIKSCHSSIQNELKNQIFGLEEKILQKNNNNKYFSLVEEEKKTTHEKRLNITSANKNKNFISNFCAKKKMRALDVFPQEKKKKDPEIKRPQFKF